jgi:glutathione synthase/RimK-type ligase-like ATP-grasp enzyme
MKILITNCLARKTFDVVNILLCHYGKNQLIFCYAENESFRVELIYKPINIEILRNSENFDKDLTDIEHKYKNTAIVYIPFEEETTLKFLGYVNFFKPANFQFSLPILDDFELSRNKKRLNLFCEANNIPCPKFISKEDIQNNNFTFPIIIKPNIGSGSKGLKFILHRTELEAVRIDYENYFVQELLSNSKEVFAGFYLCKNGEILSFYNHERIRTFPKKGGVSVYSKSGNDDKIKLAGTEIIRKLNWTGLLMIEFLQDEITGNYKLIEINPRLWGSIMLSEFNGSSFIESYIQLSLGNTVKSSRVKTDVFIRWIFPYDFLYFFENPVYFFRKENNVCYLNFTYSNCSKSIKFIFLTYFGFKKIFSKINA